MTRTRHHDDGFAYSLHRTRQAAELALEDYYASGEIDSSDEARIEKQRDRYAVVLRMLP